MSDDDMHGLDHLDAATESRLAKDAVGRYISECVKAAKQSTPVYKSTVDAVEVLLQDAQGKVLARYPWIYDPMVGMARLK